MLHNQNYYQSVTLRNILWFNFLLSKLIENVINNVLYLFSSIFRLLAEYVLIKFYNKA